MKVCVYAIAKNEEENINAWLESMKEADEIYVLVDGTSTDNTYNILKERGVHVKRKKFTPFRFDTARNASLEMVPEDADVCVCTDLDEVFTSGWRKVLEENWKSNTNLAYYDYWHNAGSTNSVPNIFKYYKIHDRHSFVWKWPIHEYIVAKDPTQVLNSVVLPSVMLKHYPKNKVRPYTDMLKEAVKRTPDDVRMLCILAESYLSENNLAECEKILLKVRAMPTIKTDSYHFGFTYKMLSQLEKRRKNFEKAKNYCYEAMSVMDNCRTILCELATNLIELSRDYEMSIAYLNKALKIKTYIISEREHEWKDDAVLHNYLCIAYWRLGKYKESVNEVNISLKIGNKNSNMYQTYVNNKKICENSLNASKNKTKTQTETKTQNKTQTQTKTQTKTKNKK